MKDMKKGILLLVVSVVLASIVLSGCQDSKSSTTKLSTQNVILDSTIVEFKNVSLEKIINKSGGVDGVTASWLFHNIAGKTVSANINVQFYDSKNNLLYNETKQIFYMPPNYSEGLLTPANKVTLEGAKAAFVDHVIISVTEIPQE
jgi:uncharacterized protein YcfL